MAPVIIGIGAGRSSGGKTTVACNLLSNLPGWGAIKCTPSSIYTSVVDDPATLSQPGKDTARYLEAGAKEAQWVKSSREDMPETLQIALDRFSHLPGILIEGNSAIEVTRPDVIIFIAPGGAGDMKEGSERVLAVSHLVLYKEAPPKGTPGEARAIQMDDISEYIKFIQGVIDGRRT